MPEIKYGMLQRLKYPELTKEKACEANDFHINHSAELRKDQTCERWRRNGKTQVWVRSPERFRTPIKFGVYAYGQLTEDNAREFHLASECPVESLKAAYEQYGTEGEVLA